MMTETLAREHVGEMQFDGRNLGGRDGVAQRDRGVGVGAGVDDETGDGAAGALNPVDEDALVIGLAHLHRGAQRAAGCAAALSTSA